MNYNELISGLTIYNNPPKKKGYDRHHIVPKDEQVKMFGSVIDERQVYVSIPMHMWLHILYDREHGTKTSARFLSFCGQPMSYFDCWEKCLAYSYTLRKKREERDKKAAEACRTPEVRQKRSDVMKGDNNPFYGQHHTEETKKKIADAHTGTKHTEEARQKIADSSKGRKWFNNGVINTFVYECPEGFVPGRLFIPPNKNHRFVN